MRARSSRSTSWQPVRESFRRGGSDTSTSAELKLCWARRCCSTKAISSASISDQDKGTEDGVTNQPIDAAYALARQRYADAGVDSDAAMRRLASVSVSLHCWQGDDVGGFENRDGALG